MAIEFKPVGVANEPVENDVCECGLVDYVVPGVDVDGNPFSNRPNCHIFERRIWG